MPIHALVNRSGSLQSRCVRQPLHLGIGAGRELEVDQDDALHQTEVGVDLHGKLDQASAIIGGPAIEDDCLLGLRFATHLSA